MICSDIIRYETHIINIRTADESIYNIKKQY